MSFWCALDVRRGTELADTSSKVGKVGMGEFMDDIKHKGDIPWWEERGWRTQWCNPAHGPHLATEEPTAAELDSAKLTGNDVIKVPQHVAAVLHDVAQGDGALGAADVSGHGAAVAAAAGQLRRRLRHFLDLVYEPHECFAGMKLASVAARLAHQQQQPAERTPARSGDSLGQVHSVHKGADTRPLWRARPGDRGKRSLSQGPGEGVAFQQQQQQQTLPPQRRGLEDGATMIRALVYVSENYKDDGEIRHEYIARMAKAAADAVALGVSQGFVDRNIRPHLVEKRQPETLPDAEDVGSPQQPESRQGTAWKLERAPGAGTGSLPHAGSSNLTPIFQ